MSAKRVLIVGSDSTKYSPRTKALIKAYKEIGYEIVVHDDKIQGTEFKWIALDKLREKQKSSVSIQGLVELELRWLLADAQAGKRVLIVTAMPELKLVLLKELAKEFTCKFEFVVIPSAIEVRKL